ncbi:MAG: hypothetical protein WD737_03595 [Gemmatimonadota bacterium]
MIRTTRRLAAVTTVAVALTLGGCGMTLSGPGSMGVLGPRGIDNALRFNAGCVLTGTGIGATNLTAAAAAGQRLRQVYQLQSRFMLGSSDVRAARAGWKSIAEGC